MNETPATETTSTPTLVVEIWRNENGAIGKVHENGSVTYLYEDLAVTVPYAVENRPVYAPAHDKLTEYGYVWVLNQYESEIPAPGVRQG